MGRWPRTWSGLGAGLGSALLCALPALAQQSDRERAQQDQIEALQQQLEVVVEELGRLRTEVGVPEEPELKGAYGLGPAASKVYGVPRGLSIGGYAEGVYRTQLGDAEGGGDATSDFTRAVLYFGYKYADWLVFNTELEFEHASTGEDGDVSVELATLDFLLRPELNVRAGLLLLPMGFVNEVHEPPFYYGTERPLAERQIIPSTWRENGVGVFGSLGEDVVSYRLYVTNGFDATGFGPSGLRGGRQKGSRTRSNDLAVVARLDLEPSPGVRLGGSYYDGRSGQDQEFTQPLSGLTVEVPNARTRIWEVHGDLRRGALHARALWAESRVADAGRLSSALELAPGGPIARRMIGGYGEVAWDLMPLLRPGSEKSLIPFFRFEYLDTQNDVPSGFTRDRGQPRRLFIPGVHFKPHPNVVLKLDYRNVEAWGDSEPDLLSVGMGLVF